VILSTRDTLTRIAFSFRFCTTFHTAATLFAIAPTQASPLRLDDAHRIRQQSLQKLSVLGGNLLLGSASAGLSRIGNTVVTDLTISIITNLMKEEIQFLVLISLSVYDVFHVFVACIPQLVLEGHCSAWHVRVPSRTVRNSYSRAYTATIAVGRGHVLVCSSVRVLWRLVCMPSWYQTCPVTSMTWAVKWFIPWYTTPLRW
jgi:hypothetical protein